MDQLLDSPLLCEPQPRESLPPIVFLAISHLDSTYRVCRSARHCPAPHQGARAAAPAREARARVRFNQPVSAFVAHGWRRACVSRLLQTVLSSAAAPALPPPSSPAVVRAAASAVESAGRLQPVEKKANGVGQL